MGDAHSAVQRVATEESSETSTHIHYAEDDNGQYLEAHGHKYHVSGKIFIPFDEPAQKHMNGRHRVLRLCLDGALTNTRLCPEIKKIVDVGTGTGVWAVEMAARYPGAEIVGMDISKIQRSLVPGNVNYVIADVEEPWIVADQSVDFVHMRAIAGGIRDWPALISQAYQKLKPGGLLEMTEIRTQAHDFDGKFNDADIFPAYTRAFKALSDKVGVEFDPAPKFPAWLHDAGFENVTQRMELLPIGHWAKDHKLRTRQKLFNELVTQFLEHHSAMIFAGAGWDKDTFDAEQAILLRELYDSSRWKPYVMAVFTTSRRPITKANNPTPET